MWLRRILAVIALLGGLGAAWWQSRAQSQTVQAAWLLSHVAVSVEGVVLDRGRLTAIGWRVADHEPKTWNWLHFALGQAPEVTEPVALLLPNDATQIEITCRLQVLPDTVPLRTRARVPTPTRGTGVLPIDAETCGELAR